MGVPLGATLLRFCHRHAMSFLPKHGVVVAKTQWHQAKVMNLSIAGGVDAHSVMWDLVFNGDPENGHFTGNGVRDNEYEKKWGPELRVIFDRA